MGEITSGFGAAFADGQQVSKRLVRALGPTIEEAIANALGNVSVAKSTKALLDADLAWAAGSTALVYADATAANNDLYVKSGGSGSGSWTNTGFFTTAFTTKLGTKPALRRGQTFVNEVDDEYRLKLVKAVSVEGGVADEDGRYVLNYETLLIGGTTYRAQFKLYDTVLAANVATWSRQDTVDWSLTAPETVKLTLAALGSPLAGYQGIVAMVWVDWDEIDWTKPLTTDTAAADGGIRRDCVIEPEAMDDFYMTPRPRIRLTFGASGEYATFLAAVQSLYKAGVTVTRSTYPISDICSYSNQVLIECVDDGHDETIALTTISSVDQSPLVLPPYCIVKLRQDTIIRANTGSNSGPVIENPWSSWIEGGTIYQQNATGNGVTGGYVVHEDHPNALTIAGDDGVLRFVNRHVYKRVLFKSASSSAMIGAGTADGSGTLVDECRFDRTGAATAPNHYAHTSPNCAFPGFIHWRSTIPDDGSGTPAISVEKNQTQTVQHSLIIENSPVKLVTASNSAGGSSGYVRRGVFAGLTANNGGADGTYSTMLDP